MNDERTHNDVNELTARDTDADSSDDYTLTYDAVGNMTDDGEDFEFEYDAFGRLRKVKDTSDQSLIAEYRYNGLGFRIAVHEDTDTDGDVDGSDLWYYDSYDYEWRDLARFRDTDTSPKEECLYHAAGLGGWGDSTYIDQFVFRDRDGTYTAAADGVLEARAYYCQNWRADVSVVVGKRAQLRHWIKYSAYGVPFGIPGGDTDSNGDCDATDVTQVQTWIDAPAYDVRGDIDLDGDVDADDKSTIISGYQGDIGGRGVLSPSAVGHRKGYAGASIESYESQWSVRFRVLSSAYGRWTARDLLAYIDGANQYQYAEGMPVGSVDPYGLWAGLAASYAGSLRRHYSAHPYVPRPATPSSPSGNLDPWPPQPTRIEDDAWFQWWIFRVGPWGIRIRIG